MNDRVLTRGMQPAVVQLASFAEPGTASEVSMMTRMRSLAPRLVAMLLAAALVTMNAPAVHAEWVTTAAHPWEESPANTYLVPSSPDGIYVSKQALDAATAENDEVNAEVLRRIEAQRNAPQGVGPSTCDRIESAAQRNRCFGKK